MCMLSLNPVTANTNLVKVVRHDFEYLGALR